MKRLSDLFTPAMLAYVAGVVIVNLGFSYLPLFHTPLGTFAPMAIVVGGIFVLRDYAQRSAGHGVLAAMAVGVLLSYLLAAPYVALASAAAFAVSELVDWLVYTRRKDLPFASRVLLSSIVATPVDSLIFLVGIGGFNFSTFVIMVTSKLLVAFALYYRHWGREQANKRLANELDRLRERMKA